MFSCEFCEIFKNTFFIEHLWATASGLLKPCLNSDLYFIPKTSSTALIETVVSYKLLQKNRETRRPEVCNFIKTEILAQVFSCGFCEISKNTFFYRTSLSDCFCMEFKKLPKLNLQGYWSQVLINSTILFVLLRNNVAWSMPR